MWVHVGSKMAKKTFFIHKTLQKTLQKFFFLLKPGLILETEGSVQNIQERALFHHKKVKKGTLIFTAHYVHSLFTIVLIKQTFEKNKS